MNEREREKDLPLSVCCNVHTNSDGVATRGRGL